MLVVGADFAWTWPDAGALWSVGVREVFFYSGPALPSQDVLDSYVRTFGRDGLCGIFETVSDRAETGGYAGGYADANYHEARMQSRGLGGIKAAFVMSDGSAYTPSGTLPGTAEYARGIGDRLQRWFTAYGNEYSVGAAQRGSPLALIDWIPETWTSRQGLGVRQLVGAVPIDGIDLNHRFVDWPGTTSVPKRKRAKGMWTALHRRADGVIEACAVGGSTYVGPVGGAPGAFGIPQEAIDRHDNDGIPMQVVDDIVWSSLVQNYYITAAKARTDVLAAIAAIPASSGGGVSKADVTAAVNDALNGVELQFTARD